MFTKIHFRMYKSHYFVYQIKLFWEIDEIVIVFIN